MFNTVKPTDARMRFWFATASILAAYAQVWLRFPGPWLTGPNLLFLILGVPYLAGTALWQPGRGATDRARGQAWYFPLLISLAGALVLLCPVKGPEIILLFPLLAQAIFSLSLRGAATVWLILFAVELSTIGYPCAWETLFRHTWDVLAAFVIVMGFSYLIVRETHAREEAERLARNLEAANARLRGHAAEVEELTVTRERNRLAREIHDGLGHNLTAAAIQIEAAGALMQTNPERATASLGNARSLTQEALTEVRRSVESLRSDSEPPPLTQQIQQLGTALELQVFLEVLGTLPVLSPALEHTLFRTVQEGLTNVRKHARTPQATVRLDFQTHRLIRLAVLDEGREPGSDRPTGFGLNGVRERVEMLGGRMEAGRRAGGGFQLTVELPQ